MLAPARCARGAGSGRAAAAPRSRARSRPPAAPTPPPRSNTTGPEILSDFAGRRLDYFVTGWGTGGTMTGAGEMLRLARPEVQIVATEPEGAALLDGKAFTPHKIQGW